MCGGSLAIALLPMRMGAHVRAWRSRVAAFVRARPRAQVLADKWDRPYSREQAAYPAPWLRDTKFWPTTSRVDNVYGDRNLVTRLE